MNGKADDVVDLVRIVAAAGRDDRIRPCGACSLRVDLRDRIGERQDQRPLGHRLDHRLGDDVGRRQAEEHVRALDRLGQRAHRGRLGVARLVGIHERRAAGVDHAFHVHHEHVLVLEAERHEQVEAGERGGAGAAGHEPDLAQSLADQVQPVQDRGRDDDRGAVLIVVKHRDAHAGAELCLDLEAFRRLDVLEIDCAEGRLQRGDDLDQLVRVALVDLDVESVDAGELLEQNGLAFHHRLGGKRADRAEAEHGGAIADHADQIAACSEVGGLGRVGRDQLGSSRDARRIGERQIPLIGERFGRD